MSIQLRDKTFGKDLHAKAEAPKKLLSDIDALTKELDRVSKYAIDTRNKISNHQADIADLRTETERLAATIKNSLAAIPAKKKANVKAIIKRDSSGKIMGISLGEYEAVLNRNTKGVIESIDLVSV